MVKRSLKNRRSHKAKKHSQSRASHKRMRGGMDSHLPLAVDQLLVKGSPSSHSDALDKANALVPGVNSAYVGGKRVRRTVKRMMKRLPKLRLRMKGGSAECVSWHGTAGNCVKAPLSYDAHSEFEKLKVGVAQPAMFGGKRKQRKSHKKRSMHKRK